MNVFCSITGLWFLAVCCLCCPGRLSAHSGSEQSDRPVLLVLKIAETASEKEREAMLIAELELTLDSYRTVTIDKTDARDLARFAELNIRQRLAQIRILAHSKTALATIWVEEGDTDMILLHLVATNARRTQMRILEIEEGRNTEVALAMAVDEIVGQIYLFNATNTSGAIEASPASEKLGARSKERSSHADAEKERPDSVWRSLYVNAVGRVGVAGVHGPRLTAGGGMGLSFGINRLAFLSSGLNVIAGPFEDTNRQRIKRLSLEPHIGAGLFFIQGRYGLGGGVFIAVPWLQTTITLPSTGTHLYSGWNIRFSFRFSFQLRLSSALALSFSPDLGLWLDQTRYYSESSDRSIFINPRLDGGLCIGVILKN